MASYLKYLLLLLMLLFIKADYKLSNDFNIPESAHQISFVVKAKTMFGIRLKGNPTTGYTWIMINGKSYKGSPSDGIVPINLTSDSTTTNYNQEKHTLGMTGFGGSFQFIFEAGEASDTLYPLVFSYRRPWEDETIQAAKVVTVLIKIIK